MRLIFPSPKSADDGILHAQLLERDCPALAKTVAAVVLRLMTETCEEFRDTLHQPAAFDSTLIWEGDQRRSRDWPLLFQVYYVADQRLQSSGRSDYDVHPSSEGIGLRRFEMQCCPFDRDDAVTDKVSTTPSP